MRHTEEADRRGKSNVTAETEIILMQPQDKECLDATEAREGKEQIFA